jgi:hypothetical protein
MRVLLGLLIITALSGGAFAQTGPDVIWTRTFGGTSNLCATAVIATSDGNFLVAGGYGPHPDTIWTPSMFKLTPTGDTLWSHSSNFITNPIHRRLRELPNGNYEMLGLDQYPVTCFRSDGTPVQTPAFIFGWGDYQSGWNVWFSPFSANWLPTGFVALGIESWYSSGNYGIHLQFSITDSAGHRTRHLNGSQSFSLSDILFHSPGQIVAIDYCRPAAGIEGWVLETGDTCGVSTERQYLSDLDLIQNPILACDAQGNVFIGGKFNGNAEVQKFSPSLTHVWSHSYGTSLNESCNSLAFTSDGGIVGCGTQISGTDSNTANVYLFRLDANGNLLWQRSYGGPNFDQGVDIAVAPDGGFIVTGSTRSSVTGLWEIWVMKTTRDPALDASEPEANLPLATALLACYPNPFNPTAQIAFDLEMPVNVTIRIYDISGRLIKTLVDHSLDAGSHSVMFDGSNLPSGVYFARLQAGEFASTQKLMLLK